jgi:hypothetical protein
LPGHGIKILFFLALPGFTRLDWAGQMEAVGALERWSVGALGCGMDQIAMFFDSTRFEFLDWLIFHVD